MTKIDKLKLFKLIHSIGLKYNLPDSVIRKIVESPYEFTAEQIKELDFTNVTTEEELGELKTNFMYRNFGKIYVSFPILKRRIKNKIKKQKLLDGGSK